MHNSSRRITRIAAVSLIGALFVMAACSSPAGGNTADISGSSQPTEASAGAPERVDRGQGRNTILTDDPALGPVDAPITFIEYGDFGCIDCKDWQDAGTLKEIKAKYGDNIRIIWRDYPIVTLQSPKASEAARCAYDQGKFWEYHDLLFERFPELEVDDLKSYATELGLDGALFNQCLDSGWHAEDVDRGEREAIDLGFVGVPSFVVNEKKLVGVLDAEYLESVIDPMLPAN